MNRLAAALFCLLLPASGAQAQLRLPGGIGLSRLPMTVDPLLRAPAQALSTVERLREEVPLQDLRRSTARALLRRHRDEVEADPAGEPVRRGQLLLWSPRAETLEAAGALGYALLSDQRLEGLDERRVSLRPPRGMALAEALQRLRALDAALEVDFNHLYQRSGDVGGPATAPAPAPAAAAAASAALGSGPARRVGLVDSGVDSRHPALRAASLRAWGCEDGRKPSAHGTAVASLLVGRESGFAGSAPEATLYAADIYCGSDTGGGVDGIVQALAWLARERVAVINISLVGPPNRVLERAVATLLARGHVLVAAVGNDGPAAPPLYPAAYPGVVGVTGVNSARAVLPEAARGPQVVFAAPGADLAAALAGGRSYSAVRGTSFAAPLVAGLLAVGLDAPDPVGAAAAVAALAGRATDLGAPGRDPVFGHGLVGETLQTPMTRAPR